jgi:hypothetical protein
MMQTYANKEDTNNSNSAVMLLDCYVSEEVVVKP